jgi:hypothetical protein
MPKWAFSIDGRWSSAIFRPVELCCQSGAGKPAGGRRTVSISGIIVLSILATAAMSFRKCILEGWYLHQLDSDQADTRRMAAAKLGRMKSLKAVPRLVRSIVKGTDPERVEVHGSEVSAMDRTTFSFTPIAFALHSIGSEGLSYALEAVEGPMNGSEGQDASLRSIIVLSIVQAWKHPESPVLRISYQEKTEDP